MTRGLSWGLAGNPFVELFRSLDKEFTHHDTVSDSAHFRTLDIETSDFGWLEPTRHDSTRDSILLETELRYREVVKNVDTLKFVVIRGINFQMKLIDGLDIVLGTKNVVSTRHNKTPGPLLTNHTDGRLSLG